MLQQVVRTAGAMVDRLRGPWKIEVRLFDIWDFRPR